MKEIQKVVQKLSREQKSAAGGAASGGGVQTGTKTVTPGIPGWLNKIIIYTYTSHETQNGTIEETFLLNTSYSWLSAILQYLHCKRTGVTAVLQQAIDMKLYTSEDSVAELIDPLFLAIENKRWPLHWYNLTKIIVTMTS